jgi:UDP-N-acetylglucosamine 2-epimerase
LPILYSCHPRSRNRLAASDFKLDKRVIQHEPLGFHDYNCLQMNKNGDYGIPVPDYIEENVSTKVVKIIQSYTGIVNKMVWRKF